MTDVIIAILGIALGLVVGAAAAAVYVQRRVSRSRGRAFLGGGNSWVMHGRDPETADIPDEAVRHMATARAIEGSRASRLVTVVGVGRAVELAGAKVELLSVEVRERGGELSYRLLLPRRPSGAFGFMNADISLEDDAGTAYIVAPASGGGGGGERGASTWDATAPFVPAPAATATTLVVTFASFGRVGPPFYDRLPPELRTEPIDGPWRFEVPVTERGVG